MQFNVFHRNPFRGNTIQTPVRPEPAVAGMSSMPVRDSAASVSCFSSIIHYYYDCTSSSATESWLNIQAKDSIVQRSYRDACVRPVSKKKRQLPAALYRLIQPSYLWKCGNNRLGTLDVCFRMMCLDQVCDVLYLCLGHIHHHQQTAFINCLFIFL
jgi:hypothetical protein